MTSDGTKKRIFRVPDDIWLPFAAEAQRRGETMSDAIRRFMVDYAAQRDRDYPGDYGNGNT
jgi:macrodomain Ter protein organizer (MatP/YcbG family)